MKHLLRSFLWMGFAAFMMLSVEGCKSKPKDSDILTAIDQKKAALSELSGVVATVKEGVVTLTGEVKDDASRVAFENTVKSIPGVASVVNSVTVAPPPPPPAPVVIAADDPLTKGVTDATKDFAGVTATVKDGVVTLTGELKRTDLPRLMKSLNTLKPKKIENKLTLK